MPRSFLRCSTYWSYSVRLWPGQHSRHRTIFLRLTHDLFPKLVRPKLGGSRLPCDLLQPFFPSRPSRRKMVFVEETGEGYHRTIPTSIFPRHQVSPSPEDRGYTIEGGQNTCEQWRGIGVTFRQDQVTREMYVFLASCCRIREETESRARSSSSGRRANPSVVLAWASFL